MTSTSYYLGAGDNGGVHINSGINNKAAFLMVDGGTFNGQTIAALGIPKTAKIYYEAQTNLLTSGSDYADLQTALYQGCTNLVGTSGITAGDCQQVWNTTLAVEMQLQPAPGYNPEAPVCQAGQMPATVLFDNIENGTANFSFGALAGTLRWGVATFSVHSGDYALFGYDYPPAVTDAFAALANGIAIPSNGFLHFAHFYAFEVPSFDGGVLEYSANGGDDLDRRRAAVRRERLQRHDQRRARKSLGRARCIRQRQPRLHLEPGQPGVACRPDGQVPLAHGAGRNVEQPRLAG